MANERGIVVAAYTPRAQEIVTSVDELGGSGKGIITGLRGRTSYE
ncbi:hypothetical protein [Pasteuria penetrans]|nr:hypothetical protein [Pasteuria penetrans]